MSHIPFMARLKSAIFGGFIIWVIIPLIIVWFIKPPLQLGSVNNSYNTVINYNGFGDGGRGELGELASRVAMRFNIEPQLFHALITQESSWNPNAVSLKGARGLGQVMPETAKKSCRIEDPDTLFNPEINLNCSAHILASEIIYWMDKGKTYYQAVRLGLACYNAGRNAVINRNALQSFPETKKYVRLIMTNYTGE